MRVEGTGFRVQGTGYRVEGPGFMIWGIGFKVWVKCSGITVRRLNAGFRV